MHEYGLSEEYEPGSSTEFPQFWWAHLLGLIIPLIVVFGIVGIAIATDPPTAKKVFALIAQVKK